MVTRVWLSQFFEQQWSTEYNEVEGDILGEIELFTVFVNAGKMTHFSFVGVGVWFSQVSYFIKFVFY